MQAASQSTIRYKNKEPISVLDGIPVGIKDELNIKHFRTNCGRAKQMPINKEDCNTVAALRSFGVVFIGNELIILYTAWLKQNLSNRMRKLFPGQAAHTTGTLHLYFTVTS